MNREPQNKTALDGGIMLEMLAAARAAAANAYAPYSRFHVGAVLLDEHGRLFSGCNVENASFGLTICAERNAIAAAICAGARTFQAILVYTATEGLTPPCGACRQVLMEFGRQMEVHLVNREGHGAVYRLEDLLPGAFEFRPEA